MLKRKRGRPGITNGVSRHVVFEADILARIEQLEPAGRDFSSKVNVILRRLFERAPELTSAVSAVQPMPSADQPDLAGAA